VGAQLAEPVATAVGRSAGVFVAQASNEGPKKTVEIVPLPQWTVPPYFS
jgi:hypothetical protein